MLTFLLVNENWLSGSLLLEHRSIGLQGTLWSTEYFGGRHVRVGAALQVVLAREVCAHWLGCRLQAKSAASWVQVGWILAFVALLFLGYVLLLRDQVVDALVKLH